MGRPLGALSLSRSQSDREAALWPFAFVCVRRDSWPAIEHERARDGIIRWCGTSIYKRFWEPLFDHKFYEYADNISGGWIWTRIRRIGRSRKRIFQEELGYIEGERLL